MHILNNFDIQKIVSSIIVIIISIIIYKIINGVITKNKNKGTLMISSRSKTYIRMMSSALRYIFVIITILIVLQINNVDVSSMLAGIGLLGAIFGLAMQDVIKDIIRGFSILSDDYFSVGDIIKYNDIEGKVLVIGLQTTKVKDINTQNVVAIANRNIQEVQVVSTQLDIEVPLSYELDKEKAEVIIEKIINNIKNKNIKCEYRGINKLNDSSVNYLIRINCKQETKPQTRRDAIGIIVDTLEENNIEIPYNQIDVHTK